MTTTEQYDDAAVVRLLDAIRKQAHQDAVLTEVGDELDRQEEKWGEQNHPNGTGPGVRFLDRKPLPSRWMEFLAVQAKEQTDTLANEGQLTYRDIFLEEVFEALAEEDPAKLRAELIQCAAVAAAWVQKIDRDSAKKDQ